MVPPRYRRRLFWHTRPAFCLLLVLFIGQTALGDEAGPGRIDYRTQIEPILTEYCYECHGFGEKNGQVAFDELKTDEQLLNSRELWWKVLRNVRSGIMPPDKNPRPSEKERALLAAWIKHQALGIDPTNPDPGRVTLRRLNRAEYRNTIRDLMGYDFLANEEFPADDTGYGFDNIGDVLTVSPLLLEKYLSAAETIVATAVPTEPKAIQEETIRGRDFKSDNGKLRGIQLSFYDAASVSTKYKIKQEGSYRVHVDLQVKGRFSFDPGQCRAIFTIDGREVVNEKYGWADSKKYTYDVDQQFSEGEHVLALELQPLTDLEKKVNSLDLSIAAVRIEGPLEEQFRVPTKNYDRFFTKEKPPEDAAERREYAQEILSRFVRRAFRRPADPATIDRLVNIAETSYGRPGVRFEAGIQRAMVAALASPYFLFRIENVGPEHAEAAYPPVDEYALASRLSYFLWSTMPDDELLRLAEQGELRKNLPAQVQRMVKDERSQALVANFVGQWLQVRDVEGIAIDERAIAERDNLAMKKLNNAAENAKNDIVRKGFEALLEFQRNKFNLASPLRKAMQQEVEMLLAYIVREDRGLLELVDGNYTFVNQVLAQYYGLPAVEGDELRRVDLPADSPRGGVLTTGAVLIVTSNPDRTSPVKRGLFVLDNILGAPPPPPPANVPALEVAEKEAHGRTPTMRESLEIHRSKPLCNSCHSRMDPLGLGFENFNALGRWRERERGEPIDSRGQLSSGESFASVRDLKQILVRQYHEQIYRCLTEKLFTYALGRGLTYMDADQVDQIVDRLENGEGRFSILLTGIIDSPQFQRRRQTAEETAKPAE